MTSSDPAAEPGSNLAAAAEVERLRVELEHRDQLLAAVYARADALQREIELLERQLNAAIETQREAATERAELRRLLGNAQLQVHSLLRIAPPGREGAPVAASEEPQVAVEVGPTEPLPPSAEPPATGPPPAEPPPAAPAAAAEPAPARRPTRPAPTVARGIVDDAREAWSNLRRLF